MVYLRDETSKRTNRAKKKLKEQEDTIVSNDEEKEKDKKVCESTEEKTNVITRSKTKAK
tara:strand:+ start:760 stop:936 length:177 start_codon:yes stop_codon:yes gene_type:complete